MKFIKFAQNLILRNSNVKFQCKYVLNKQNDHDFRIEIRYYVTFASTLSSRNDSKLPLDDQNNQLLMIPLLRNYIRTLKNILDKNENLANNLAHLSNFLCSSDVTLTKLAEGLKIEKPDQQKIASLTFHILKSKNKLNAILTEHVHLRYYIDYKYFNYLMKVKRETSTEAWVEISTGFIQKNKPFFKELMHFLIKRKEFDLIFLILNEYSRKEQTIPRDVQLLLKDFQKEIKSVSQSKIETKDQFYNPAELVDANIIYVDDENKFRKMVKYIQNTKPDVIGMDCEWQPEFKTLDEIIQKYDLPIESMEKLNRPNTFQIATRDKVFIIESKESIERISKDTLEKFTKSVLFSKDIKKLGYEFNQDAQKLKYSFKSIEERFEEFRSNITNIDQLKYQINEKEVDLANRDMNIRGLSRLVLNCFGKPLDKSECMSNWSNKPLRKAQMRYAALDAFVLIQIYDYINRNKEKLNIDKM